MQGKRENGWSRITPSRSPYIIEWTYHPGKNLRVSRGNDDWTYGSCSHSRYALLIGEGMLHRRYAKPGQR